MCGAGGVCARIGEFLLRARVEVYWRLILLFLRIPDRAMATLARWGYVAALPFVDDEEALLQVREWEVVFRTGPPLSTAVRRIIHEARAEQVKLVLRGMLVHHAPALRARKQTG